MQSLAKKLKHLNSVGHLWHNEHNKPPNIIDHSSDKTNKNNLQLAYSSI